MKRMMISFTAGILLIIGCAPATLSVTPTATLTSSFTPLPTETFSPSHTPTASSTPFQTFTPSLTSTPPPPLDEHVWFPENVLISVRGSGADGVDRIGDSGVPDYILYADGNLFVPREIKIHGNDRIQLLTKRLSRQEICQSLNTLDQVGFLDYDPTTYKFVDDSPSIMGAGSTSITVNAWKSTSGSFYALSAYLPIDLAGSDLDHGRPVILPALRDTYSFISGYPKVGFETYKPERLILWLYLDQGISNVANAKLWTLSDPSLNELVSKAGTYIDEGNQRYLILNGKAANDVYEFLDSSFSHGDVVYEENKEGLRKHYIIYARPLLPYELPGNYVSEIPAPYSMKPNFKIACHPSDGVLPIPTPSNP